jgi:type II restriction enzyme
MNLGLDASAGFGYKSSSQWARRVTEEWATRELFCVACSSSNVAAHQTNRKVEDFHCLTCGRRSQLKAKSGRIGRQVANSAYAAKIEAIRANRAPDYAFMAYDKSELRVTDLFVVPGHFLTESVVSKRNALKATTRRPGWIGSNIHLDRIPDSGKISIVEDGRERRTKEVRRHFSQVAFVANLEAEKRGWLTDVLACLDDLGLRSGSLFSNQDMFGFEDRLHRLHPGNHNVKPKIRQQLQVLASHGLVERIRPGNYRRL